MRIHLVFLTLLIINSSLFATRQAPDILHYKSKKLNLATGWGHPSPLQTYFLQTGLDYPFHSLSTGNYRGHIANWKIKNNRLILGKISIRDSVFKAKDLDVFSGQQNQIFAHWFSGIIRAYSYSKSYNEKKDYCVLIQLRKGVVVKEVEYKGAEWAKYDIDKSGLDEEKARMLNMYRNYLAFYYRLEDEKITYGVEACLLEVGWSKLSPIFQYYGNDFLRWPYTWENISISGAPASHWLIRNDSLFLSSFSLKSNTNFKGPDILKIELDSIDIGKPQAGKIFVNKVNGVYIIKHGYFPKEKENPKMYEFEETGYTLISIKNGVLVEKYPLDKYFDFEDPDEDTDTAILRLISEL